MTIADVLAGSDYKKIVMTYGDRYPRILDKDRRAKTNLHPDTDPKIRLNIYPGHPISRGSSSNPFTINIRTDGFDSCNVGLWKELYNPTSGKYFYCNHDVAVFYKAMGRVMPVVYWPYRLPEAEPSVTWSYNTATAKFKVVITAAGISDTWYIPESGSINSLAALR
jgi:hypothetical protein